MIWLPGPGKEPGGNDGFKGGQRVAHQAILAEIWPYDPNSIGR
jgi:hypothetical protein